MGLLSLLIILAAVGPSGPDPQRAARRKTTSTESVFRFYQFPGHPNLTHLCQRRIYTQTGHAITFDAFASPAAPSKLVAYYRRKLGDAGFVREGAGGRWGLPADAPGPERVLEVTAVGAENPSGDCEKRPPANSRAIIVVSRMVNR